MDNCLKDWPCEYCKKKFIDVRSVIDHELYLCEKNPKFKYSDKKNLKSNTNIKSIQTSSVSLNT